MKKSISTLFLLSSFLINAQIISFADANFKNSLVNSTTVSSPATGFDDKMLKVDANSDGEIQISEALQVKSLGFSYSCYRFGCDGVSIANFQGLTSFSNLEAFSATDQDAALLDVKNLTHLKSLKYSLYSGFYGAGAHPNKYVKIDFIGATNLEVVSLTGTYMDFDLKNLINLKELTIGSGNLSSLDLGPNTKLEKLTCYNILGAIDCNGLSNLKEITVSQCKLNNINSLSLNGVTNLKKLVCDTNEISNLNLSSCTNLEYLSCNSNKLTSIDLTGLSKLINFQCNDNLISTLNISNLPALTEISCKNNQLSSLNLNGLPNLTSLNCSNNLLSSLNVTAFSNLTTLSCSINQLTSLNVTGLSNLKTLQSCYNPITTLDLSPLTSATSIDIYNNTLSSINIKGLTNLISLRCNNNLINTPLDLTGLNNLESIDCSYNQISDIVFDGNMKLTYITCSNNLLKKLDLTGFNNLISVNCNFNQISEITFGGNMKLSSIYCANNILKTLDLSSLIINSSLNCQNNLLESLFFKNGKKENRFLEGNPTLRYICQDQDAVLSTQQYVDSLNYTNCVVSSFCSFNPGGLYYTVQGGQKFDFNNNGCDNADSSLPNIKYTISAVGSSNPADYIISNEDGSYHVDIPSGDFTVNPSFENPSYYTSNPATLNVSFPTQSSPFTQDFCITASGTHPDLEVVIIPIQQARPGFDATYKIVLRNKGTIAQSGTLNLVFDDAVLDFVSSNPTHSNESLNSLSWDFSNLNPFETKTINLVLNLNSPIETPALNMGDILHFSATVSSAETDETPLDNTFNFNQTVVNSFDPNDITCLEGETVPLTDKDFYLHYIVRFENTGNYAAQNIVVEDVIDTNVYDVASLVPMSSSHPFYTIKKSGYGIQTAVHFVFENINLPFTSGSNTGYIAFKIKTKHPYYDFAQSIWNKKANIYFDYNYPIKTNMVSTSMKTLSSQDFTAAKKNAFYPNPANDKIYFSQKQKSVTVFTIEGKKISTTLKNKEIDISELPNGIYLLQIQTIENTVITQKLIKN